MDSTRMRSLALQDVTLIGEKAALSPPALAFRHRFCVELSRRTVQRATRSCCAFRGSRDTNPTHDKPLGLLLKILPLLNEQEKILAYVYVYLLSIYCKYLMFYKFVGDAAQPTSSEGQFTLCPSREEKRHFPGPNYVQRRSLWVEKVY